MRKQHFLAILGTGLIAFALLMTGCEDSEPTAKNTWVLEVTADPATVVAAADETGEATITAVLFDENGQLKPGIGLRFSTNAGSMASAGQVIQTDIRGEARDILSLRGNAGSAEVKVKSGAVEGKVSVATGELLAPTASIRISPSGSARIGAGVLFSGSSSEDLDGEIVRYVWSILSSNPDSGKENPEIIDTTNQAINRSFVNPQHLDVSLVVYDNDGLTDSSASDYDIFANLPPIAEAGPALEGTADASGRCTVRLNGCGSRDQDPDGRIVAYVWTFQTVNRTDFSDCQFDWPFDVNENGTLVTLTVHDNGDGSTNECNHPDLSTLDDCPTKKMDQDTTTVICHPRP